MVPRKIGGEMRQRRLLVGMTQANIADAVGATRAYVSAVERGVDWDPDADKLVAWAEKLGWESDYLLRKLGRVAVPAPNVGLPPEMRQWIKRAIAEGVRQGVETGVASALRAIGEQEPAEQPGPPDPGPHPEA